MDHPAKVDAIGLDAQENIYVADRENKRIQVFDQTGNFIQEWAGGDFGRISAVTCDKKSGGFAAIDYNTVWWRSRPVSSRIMLFDPTGRPLTKSGNDTLKKEGRGCWYHNVSMDDQGSIYVTDINNNNIKKFKRV